MVDEKRLSTFGTSNSFEFLFFIFLWCFKINYKSLHFIFNTEQDIENLNNIYHLNGNLSIFNLVKAREADKETEKLNP